MSSKDKEKIVPKFVRTIRTWIDVRLAKEEVEQCAKKAAMYSRQIRAKKEELKEVQKAMKGEIEHMESEMAGFLNNVETEKQTRNVECDEVFDFEQGITYVQYGQEQYSTRTMRPEEYKYSMKPMFDDSKAERYDEPVPRSINGNAIVRVATIEDENVRVSQRWQSDEDKERKADIQEVMRSESNKKTKKDHIK